MIKIRAGRLEDVPAIARILVKSWQTHYKHFLPASLLEDLTESHQIKRHTAYMQGQAQYLVAENQQGEVVGFASFGKSRNEALYTDSELYTMYVDEAYLGKGIGSQLLFQVINKAKKHHQYLGVFVMEKNKFRSFYEKNSFLLKGTEMMDLGGVEVKNCRYVKELTS